MVELAASMGLPFALMVIGVAAAISVPTIISLVNRNSEREIVLRSQADLDSFRVRERAKAIEHRPAAVEEG